MLMCMLRMLMCMLRLLCSHRRVVSAALAVLKTDLPLAAFPKLVNAH